MNKKHAKVDPASAEGTITTRVEAKAGRRATGHWRTCCLQTIRREGEEELHRTAAALASSALAAGLSMACHLLPKAC
jgi:hypothetical protein